MQHELLLYEAGRRTRRYRRTVPRGRPRGGRGRGHRARRAQAAPASRRARRAGERRGVDRRREPLHASGGGALPTTTRRLRALVRGGAPHVRLFGELPPLRSEAQCDAWISYDAILNRAFDHHPSRSSAATTDGPCPSGCSPPPVRATPSCTVTGPTRHSPTRRRSSAPTRRSQSRSPGLRTIPAGTAPGASGEALVAAMTAAGLGRRRSAAWCSPPTRSLANAYRHAGGPPEVRAGSADGRFVCADHRQRHRLRRPARWPPPPRGRQRSRRGPLDRAPEHVAAGDASGRGPPDGPALGL